MCHLLFASFYVRDNIFCVALIKNCLIHEINTSQEFHAIGYINENWDFFRTAKCQSIHRANWCYILGQTISRLSNWVSLNFVAGLGCLKQEKAKSELLQIFLSFIPTLQWGFPLNEVKCNLTQLTTKIAYIPLAFISVSKCTCASIPHSYTCIESSSSKQQATFLLFSRSTVPSPFYCQQCAVHADLII